MITAYTLDNQILQVKELEAGDALPDHTVWIDVCESTEEEKNWLQNLFVTEVPDEDDLDDIEASSRYYQDKEGVHILSLFPQRRTAPKEESEEVSDTSIGTDGVNVSFNIRNNMMLSFHEEEVSVIRLFRRYMRGYQAGISSHLDIFLELQDLKIENLSDLIEDSYAALEETSNQVMTGGDVIKSMLKELVIQEQTCSQIQMALNDTRRALRYVKRVFSSLIDTQTKKSIDEALNDIESLLPHTQFLFDKIGFQLNAAMGFTNLQQSSIIKIFSVAAVVFMPPTWIASIYGMNFAHMPELDWLFGYPFSVGLMIGSAFFTYLYFKKKGWL